MTAILAQALSQAKPILLLLFVSCCLLACGGGSDQSSDNNQPAAPGGALVSSTKLATHSISEIRSNASALGIENPASQLLYGVTLYRLVYTTVDGTGAAVDASGVLALPQKPTQLASPLMSFQHGTAFQNQEAPSNDIGPGTPPTILAAQGYITVAADYVGYGESQGIPHPYLQAEPSARATADLLKAALAWLEPRNISLNKQLFLTGYSEGGYVTMALHRHLEAQAIPGLQLVASVPGAGPYHLTATLENLVSSDNVQQWLDNLSGRSATSPIQNRSWPDVVVGPLTDYVMGLLVPDDADVVFDDTVIRSFLKNGSTAIVQNNEHDWKANRPIRLYHGRDDTTVPFFNATDALAAMQARGSVDVMLIECTATPADHEHCIPGYGAFLSDYFHGLATGL